jgi:serine protease Do
MPSDELPHNALTVTVLVLSRYHVRETTMRFCLSLLLCFLLVACAGSGQRKFYKEYVNIDELKEIETLAKGEEPTIVGSTDLQKDIAAARSKGYIPIGGASFNGRPDSEDAIAKYAKSWGAVLVLVSSKFTNTETTTTPLLLPSTQTSTTTGTIFSSQGSATVSGSTTTHGTVAVPITTTERRFDQVTVYFVKSTRKVRFGLFVADLPMELRVQLERNTGALIENVAEGSPAFVANVIPGDVLVELNGVAVTSGRQALELMQRVPSGSKTCVLKVIRKGTERTIELRLDETSGMRPNHSVKRTA